MTRLHGRPITPPAAAIGIAAGLALLLAVTSRAEEFRNGVQIGDFVTNFSESQLQAAPILPPHRTDSHVYYKLDPGREQFLVHVPYDYAAHAQYGLVVYIHPGDTLEALPPGWQDVLNRRRLLFIAPLGAGNLQAPARRLGLAVLAAGEMRAHYDIDPQRIYAAGWSGGARIASDLAFYQSDIFHGTIQSCGSDFYLAVPHINGTANDSQGGHSYGLMDATPDEIAQARLVRFALITGNGDFRHGDLLDLYDGGFVKLNFQAKLIDVPGMQHENADAASLDAALDFIEGPR